MHIPSAFTVLTPPARRRLARAAAALCAAAAACGDEPTPPDGREGCAGDPPTLPTEFAGAVGMQALGGGAIRCRFTAEVAVRGSVAYTSTWGNRGGNVGDMIYVWDVSGSAPALRDSVRVSGAVTTGDLQVSDDGRLLVVATEFAPGSIIVYDLDDPWRPREVSRFTSPNTEPGVHTAEVARVGGRQYGFLSVDPVGRTFPARLVVVDLSDPAAPREVLSREMGDPFVHDVFVRDGILFTALWDAGLSIWDVGGAGRGGTPEAPVLLGSVATVGGSAHNVWWVHDPTDGSRRYAVVGEEQPGVLGSRSAGDVHVVDVSDLAAPREVAFYRVPGAGTHNFSMDEQRGVLYAAYYNAGVRAIDLRGDLGACDDAHRSSDGRCDLALMGREVGVGLVGGITVSVWGVVYADGSVYASDMFNGLWKLAPAGAPAAR
jgi:hypothetical protein